jgi:hypothetical protein
MKREGFLTSSDSNIVSYIILSLSLPPPSLSHPLSPPLSIYLSISIFSFFFLFHTSYHFFLSLSLSLTDESALCMSECNLYSLMEFQLGVQLFFTLSIFLLSSFALFFLWHFVKLKVDSDV